jgi:hypothetical protein
MMQDFPAAHSMDTKWFAVDADGNIGIFRSGEGGAVPSSNYTLRINAMNNRQRMSRASPRSHLKYIIVSV